MINQGRFTAAVRTHNNYQSCGCRDIGDSGFRKSLEVVELDLTNLHVCTIASSGSSSQGSSLSHDSVAGQHQVEPRDEVRRAESRRLELKLELALNAEPKTYGTLHLA